MRTRLLSLPFVLLLAVGLIGCGGETSSDGSASKSNETTTTQSSTSGEVDQTITIQPQGNQMKYKQTEFTVAPGETIELVFENTASSPSMQHNVVIAESTDESLMQNIGEAGTKAGSTNDYIPQDDALQKQIIAYTPIAKPGETVSVTFTVPKQTGEYGYVCTFPGHWATMQGTMYVEN